MRIGIDFGATKISAVAIDHDGEVLVPQRSATPTDYEGALDILVGLVADIEDELGAPASVGIGTPGVQDRDTGRIIGAENTPISGMPLATDVSRRLQRPIRVANDANCFALSEAVDGAAKGMGIVVGLILGTGAGLGLVVDGKLLEGHNGSAGEWGHNPLPWARDEELEGARCYCGKVGCLEMFVSGPGIVRDHLRATGDTLKTAAIFARAREGDAAASATVERFHDRLARSVATIVNFFDPEAIVFGGGLSQIQAIYSQLPARLGQYTFTSEPRLDLAASVHGDDSGVRGAAWLWQTTDWIRGLPPPPGASYQP